MSGSPCVIAVVLAALGMQCSPRTPSSSARTRKEVAARTPVASVPKTASQPLAQPSQPAPEPRRPAPGALRVGPTLSEEARAAGIYALQHMPYRWPTRQGGPRLPTEPLVVVVGRPVPLPLPSAERPEGWSYGMVHIEDWAEKQADGSLVLTPPADWDGLVQRPQGGSLVAYGEQGLFNYREYVRRYVPWRTKQQSTPAHLGSRQDVSVEVVLGGLATEDIDADGTPELVAYTFVEWRDAKAALLGASAELGVVWKDEKLEPAALSGFASQPNAFTWPNVAPAKLSGGRPLIFSVAYCCAGTHIHWATSPTPGQSSKAELGGDDGDWLVYLEPSEAGNAKLVIAVGERVDWDAL